MNEIHLPFSGVTLSVNPNEMERLKAILSELVTTPTVPHLRESPPIPARIQTGTRALMESMSLDKQKELLNAPTGALQDEMERLRVILAELVSAETVPHLRESPPIPCTIQDPSRSLINAKVGDIIPRTDIQIELNSNPVLFLKEQEGITFGGKGGRAAMDTYHADTRYGRSVPTADGDKPNLEESVEGITDYLYASMKAASPQVLVTHKGQVFSLAKEMFAQIKFGAGMLKDIGTIPQRPFMMASESFDKKAKKFRKRLLRVR